MKALRALLASLLFFWAALAPSAHAMLVINELNGFNAAASTAPITTDTGWVIAGQGRAVNHGSGTVAWTNPGNITVDDASNATVTIAGFGNISHWLVADTFDFSSIPDSATIDGIEVRAQLSVNTASGSTLNRVNIAKSDSTLGTEKIPATALTTSPVNYDNGTSSDLWGLSISAAEVKTSTFQARITVGNSSVANRTFSCDAMWMRVTYTYTP